MDKLRLRLKRGVENFDILSAVWRGDVLRYRQDDENVQVEGAGCDVCVAIVRFVKFRTTGVLVWGEGDGGIVVNQESHRFVWINLCDAEMLPANVRRVVMH